MVVAIIGMLSSIVLSSLNSARTKGFNSAAVSQMNSLRTEASLIFADTGTYSALCTSGSRSAQQYLAALQNGNASAAYVMCMGSTNTINSAVGVVSYGTKAATPDQWAAAIQLKDNQFYCMDYTGVARKQAARGIDTGPLDLLCD